MTTRHQDHKSRFQQLLKQFSDSFSNHKIHRMEVVGTVRGVWLRNPQRSANHVWCWELPGPVVAVYGDHHIGDHRGVVSAPGYGLNWFAVEIEPAYLAEKFLRQRWTSERAIDELTSDALWEDCIHPTAEERSVLCDAIEGASDEAEAIEALRDAWDWDWHATLPGHGYDLVELASLVTIQRTFRRLWSATCAPVVQP